MKHYYTDNLEAEELEHKGVYGILVNKEIYYIGSTLRSFQKRWKEHLYNIRSKSKSLYCYEYLCNIPEEKISFSILYDCENRQTLREELEDIEFNLISQVQPLGEFGWSYITFFLLSWRKQ